MGRNSFSSVPFSRSDSAPAGGLEQRELGRRRLLRFPELRRVFVVEQFDGQRVENIFVSLSLTPKPSSPSAQRWGGVVVGGKLALQHS